MSKTMISIFWGHNIWPGNSFDLNAGEHIGSILKDAVETRMLSETEHDRHREEKSHTRCFRKHGNKY